MDKDKLDKGPVIKYGKGGDGGETRNFEKKFAPPLKNYMPFQGPPLMHFIIFKDTPPPLVPLENIVLY
jgi:hypothetical protein